MATIDAPLDRLKQPEYTGENRCLPCTVVNSIIALLAAAVVGLVWVPAGLVALVAFAGAIYLRGYLVPGTPELTKRYLPDRALRAFGKEPVAAEAVPEGADTTGATGTPEDGDDLEASEVEELLVGGGIVEEDPVEDDLRMTERFGDVWWRRMRRFREDDEAAKTQLAAVLEIDPADLAFENDDRFVVTFEGDRIARWDSDAAFYADLAVEPTLKEWLDDWERLGDRRRTELIAGMRAFLESCPACEADVEQIENVRESCCSSKVVGVNVDCGECGARVFSGTYR